MIKFKLNNTEYNVPDFISIENYAKIYKVKDLFSDDYFAAKLLNIVTDAPIEDLVEADYQEVNYLANYVMSLIPTTKDIPFKDRFELNGVHYGFFPSWKELSFAEFVDMDTISTKKPEELLDLMHILAAVMYRPITDEKSEHDFKIEKYNIETLNDRADLFKKHLDVKYIIAAQFFFYQIRKQIFRLYPIIFDQDAIAMDEDQNSLDDAPSDMASNFQKSLRLVRYPQQNHFK